MQDDFFKVPLEVSYKSFKKINSIKFTSREIDVIACIIGDRTTTKTIAALLSIESKTVEVHARNIRIKLECNSREGIVQFIKKAGKLSDTKHHYLLLLIQSAFEQKLQQLSTLIIPKKLPCLVYYEKHHDFFIDQLRKYFKILNVEGVFKLKERDKSLKDSLQDFNLCSFAHCLFIALPLHIEQVLKKEILEEVTLSQILQNPEAITFIFPEQEIKTIKEIEYTDHIFFGSDEQYYLSFFVLFKRFFPEIIFDKLVSEFKQQYETLIHNSLNKKSIIKFSYYLFINFLKKQMGKLLISGVFCLSILYGLILKDNKLDQSLLLPQIDKGKVIRSDLPLPHDTILLKRPEIKKQIEEKLKDDQEIQTVALVGIGGSGKTTLARHYAYQQNADVIWELSAETEESLISSFENLAHALAKTEDEKKILRGLQEIKNSKEKIEKILSFISERLKTYPNWFLVYDNVEKFANIQEYFPSDLRVWGKGKVIITTRDRNIESNSHIYHAIFMEELSEKEKLELFVNILDHGNIHPLISHQKEQSQKFLTKIPSFPLDISAAAHYLKATDISYQKYLEYLRENDEDFDNMQQKILKEASRYDKTRQKIIQLSLENFLRVNKDFEELLLLVSLLDSQNIPRDLLSVHKDNSIIDNFIFHLKKYSFITNESLIESVNTFSIHRSTQEIILNILIKKFKIKKEKIFEDVSLTLENYMNKIIDEECILKIKIIKPHCESFLGYKIFPDIKHQIKIRGILGYITFLLGDESQAQNIMNETIKIFDNLKCKNHALIARNSLYYGIIEEHQNNFKQAQDYLNKSLNYYKTFFPDNKQDISWILMKLGVIHEKLCNFDKAKNFLNQSLEIREKLFEEDDVKIYLPKLYLAVVHENSGNLIQSEDLLINCLKHFEKKFGKKHRKYAGALVYLGSVKSKLGFHREAETLLREAIKIYEAIHSEDAIIVAWSSVYLANILQQMGQYNEAQKLIEKSLIAYKKIYKDEHISIRWVYNRLGMIYKDQKKFEAAEKILHKNLLIYEKEYGRKHLKTAEIISNLGHLYLLQGNFDESEKLFQEAAEIIQSYNHPNIYIILEYLSELYLQKSQQSQSIQKHNQTYCQQVQKYKLQAIDYLNQALHIVKKSFPNNSPYIARIQQKLNNL